jgi:hypothetical protein
MTNSQKVIAELQSAYGTIIGGQFEVVRQQYYDTIRLAPAGTNRLTFFANPIGSVDPDSGLQKTLEETNIRRSGELDERFVATSIKTFVEILPIQRQPAAIIALANAVVQQLTTTHKALFNLHFQGVLSVNFGQKNFIQIEQPFQMCPPGFGPSIKSIASSDLTTGTFMPLSQYTRASVDPRDTYALTPVMFIEKGQTFSTNIDFYNANTPTLPVVTGSDKAYVQVGVILDGYVIRPVQ